MILLSKISLFYQNQGHFQEIPLFAQKKKPKKKKKKKKGHYSNDNIFKLNLLNTYNRNTKSLGSKMMLMRSDDMYRSNFFISQLLSSKKQYF